MLLVGRIICRSAVFRTEFHVIQICNGCDFSTGLSIKHFIIVGYYYVFHFTICVF